MAVTREDVLARLAPEEPDYQAAAAALGQEATPVLVALVAEGDEFLVARVVSLAGTIGGACAEQVIEAARRHRSPLVRIQVAAAARTLPAATLPGVVLPLLADEDVSVRKYALDAAAASRGPAAQALREAVERMRTADPEPFLREKAVRLMTLP